MLWAVLGALKFIFAREGVSDCCVGGGVGGVAFWAAGWVAERGEDRERNRDCAYECWGLVGVWL